MGGTGHRVGEQTARMIVQPVGCVFTRTIGDGGEEAVRASTHPTLAVSITHQAANHHHRQGQGRYNLVGLLRL